MNDDNGDEIHVGDILLSTWGYQVIVEEKDHQLYGRHVCESSHSCSNMLYSLNDGKGHVIISKGKGCLKPIGENNENSIG